VAESRAPGLRTQIVLALAGLMLLAFVPLFFAVASLTRATLRGAREESARALGRVVAAEIGEAARGGNRDLLASRLSSEIGEGGVAAIAVYDAAGRRAASAGDALELELMRAPEMPTGEGALTSRGAHGRVLDVVIPEAGGAVVARLYTDEDADRAAPLVRLVALYMVVFATALLVFAYFALTRLIVRPLEALVRAADRVASARSVLDVPRAGAREIADLGQSVSSMTGRLIADEATLKRKVDELTRTTETLMITQAQLVRSERLASVGRLSAGIAHEIGNPIAAILGMEDLLLDGDLPSETTKDFIVRMKRETERIHGVVRDLLDFARPEKEAPMSGTMAQPSVVSDVVRDVIALVRPQRAFKSVALGTELEDSPLKVRLSSARLTQVLLNLLLNAGDAVDSAPLGAAKRVTVRAKRVGDQVRIEVEDSGPGIPKSLRGKLFEPFVTTKEVGSGTGLGLAVCRGIVESCGGEIALDESYEEGARFVVSLPADGDASGTRPSTL
jgi:two-component system, NtrC family, sensor kinase